MNYEVRHMGTDEIPLIAGIDRSEELREEYSCVPIENGLGLRLVRQMVNPPRHIPNWSEAGLTARSALWRQNLEDGAALIGGFDGESLAGFVLVTVRAAQGVGEILSLFVDRYYRGRGLGTALLNEAEQHCRADNVSTLVLYTGHSAPAVDFYRKRGFTIVGIQNPRFATRGFDLTLAKEI